MPAPAAPPDPLPRHVYKILHPVPAMLASASGAGGALPAAAGPLPSTPLDAQDGYIHLSVRPQVRFVLGRFYAASDEVALVKLSFAALEAAAAANAQNDAALRWEKAGTSAFPHLYGLDLRPEVIVGWRVLRRDPAAEREPGGWEAELQRVEGEGWFED